MRLLDMSRVVVSDQPGTTQQGVQINIKDTLIQDSAGVKSSNVAMWRN